MEKMRLKTMNERDTRELIGEMYHLGFSETMEGTAALRAAIALYTPGMSMTKELYPAVGKLTGRTAVQVERIMRYALKSAWEKAGYYGFRTAFPWVDEWSDAPTVSEFVSRMAVKIRYEG